MTVIASNVTRNFSFASGDDPTVMMNLLFGARGDVLAAGMSERVRQAQLRLNQLDEVLKLKAILPTLATATDTGYKVLGDVQAGNALVDRLKAATGLNLQSQERYYIQTTTEKGGNVTSDAKHFATPSELDAIKQQATQIPDSGGDTYDLYQRTASGTTYTTTVWSDGQVWIPAAAVASMLSMLSAREVELSRTARADSTLLSGLENKLTETLGDTEKVREDARDSEQVAAERAVLGREQEATYQRHLRALRIQREQDQ